MTYLKTSLTLLFALIMFAAGLFHFIKPQIYASFIPNWLPLLFVNYVVGTIESGIAIGLIVPAWKRDAAISLCVLMIAFLPLHAIDVFRLHPAIGSSLVAWVRLPVQFLLIYWAWYLIPANSLKKL
jgi:uncharacterized membrane protein